jgi:hypothetical protein
MEPANIKYRVILQLKHPDGRREILDTERVDDDATSVPAGLIISCGDLVSNIEPQIGDILDVQFLENNLIRIRVNRDCGCDDRGCCWGQGHCGRPAIYQKVAVKGMIEKQNLCGNCWHSREVRGLLA